ncbi:MAG: RNA ligase family protein, partial [Blastocatellia bacterium]
MDLLKYPRTQHIEGSRLQPGDEDLDSVSFEVLKSKPIVVEEKLDGANSGISFGTDGRLYLQSRGHFLDGGPREKHFALFKTWANTHKRALWEALGSRYVMYGEWLYAKHTVFYDRLPHYFMEFDLLDIQKREFLST